MNFVRRIPLIHLTKRNVQILQSKKYWLGCKNISKRYLCTTTPKWTDKVTNIGDKIGNILSKSAVAGGWIGLFGGVITGVLINTHEHKEDLAAFLLMLAPSSIAGGVVGAFYGFFFFLLWPITVPSLMWVIFYQRKNNKKN
ncbi:MAG: hypothetical protein Satyrvirus2_56 [Satyrvirus sp.]|uniref:Transmembrane protein n=1 Tax=Satyrvirus sp. TaxID=2487771 RepID=A0A3G5ACU9_9VIRU|nr:MAG: hypothetical protein Satyrvirus2_56 [Satyrvirus sp.]